MALHLRRWFDGDAADVRARQETSTTLLLLHGFTQNSNCWGRFADELAQRFPVVAIDAPGHGLSDPSHDRADLWETADLIRTEAIDESVAPPIVIGYSMGGRTALHLALAHPHSMSGLVLIGASPGIVDDAARAERRAADADLANCIRQEPIGEFLDRWLAQPLFAGLDAEAAAKEARLANRSEGLASSLECCGTGSQEPLWDRLHELKMPVLLITGSEDAKFGALAREMSAVIVADRPDADVGIAELPGTHAVHMERPSETAECITRWLDV